MEQVALPQHPIVVGARNICQFVHEKKLGSLKIVELQSVCDQLDTEPSGSLLRKKSYITSIETYVVKTCQCFRDLRSRNSPQLATKPASACATKKVEMVRKLTTKHDLAPVVQRLDNAIRRKNHYPADKW